MCPQTVVLLSATWIPPSHSLWCTSVTQDLTSSLGLELRVAWKMLRNAAWAATTSRLRRISVNRISITFQTTAKCATITFQTYNLDMAKKKKKKDFGWQSEHSPSWYCDKRQRTRNQKQLSTMSALYWQPTQETRKSKTKQENKDWIKRQSRFGGTRGKCLMTCPIPHKDICQKNIFIYEETHLSQIPQWKWICVFLEVWRIKWKLKTNEFSEDKRNLQAPGYFEKGWSHEYIALHSPGAGGHVERWLLIVAQLGCRMLETRLNQTEQDSEEISTGPRRTRYSGWQSVCNVSRTEWEPPRCAIPPTSLEPSQ